MLIGTSTEYREPNTTQSNGDNYFVCKNLAATAFLAAYLVGKQTEVLTLKSFDIHSRYAGYVDVYRVKKSSGSLEFVKSAEWANDDAHITMDNEIIEAAPDECFKIDVHFNGSTNGFIIINAKVEALQLAVWQLMKDKENRDRGINLNVV
jgi:hypothetical protein